MSVRTLASLCCAGAVIGGQLVREPAAAHAVDDGSIQSAYQAYEQGLEPFLDGAAVRAYWVDDRTVGYVTLTAGRTELWRYDLQTGATTRPPVDPGRLAQALSAAAGQPIEASTLALKTSVLQADGSLRISGGGAWYQCTESVCTSIGRRELYEGWPRGLEINTPPSVGPVVSPDGRHGVDAIDGNLVLVDPKTAETRPVTQDGSPLNAYGNGVGLSWGGANIALKKMGFRPSPSVLWSADSRRFFTVRVDLRKVREYSIVDTSAGGGDFARPQLYSYRYAMAGDAERPLVTPLVVDVASGAVTALQLPPFTGADDPIATGAVRWSPDGESIDYIDEPLEGHRWSFWRSRADSGQSRQIHSESFPEFLVPYTGRAVALPGGREVLIWSQRDDFGRLYRYEASSGRLMNEVSHGPLFVHQVARVVADGRRAPWIYFLAGEEAAGRNPHDRQLYRVRADGREQQRLATTASRQEVEFSPDGSHFLLRGTRPDAPPSVTVYRADGRKMAELGRPRWVQSGPPVHIERFVLGAEQLPTAIYGVLYRPKVLQPNASHPVLHYVYGGPYTVDQPSGVEEFKAKFAVGLARLGIAVVFFDGQGTWGRRYRFNQYPPGQGYEACNLSDAARVIHELAASRPWMDATRVGIAGWSNGGYCALRGLLAYPQLYRVAVAGAGNHDQRIQGIGVTPYLDPRDEGPLAWERQSNLNGLERLQGNLLLVQGEIDESVPIANALRVAEKLAALDKPFDMLVLPGRTHGLVLDPYVIKREYRFLFESLGQRTQ